MSATCSHKTMRSHSRVTDRSTVTASPGPQLASGSVRLWTCSDCGKEGVWTRRWAYYGALECTRCERTVIDRVSCGCKAQKEVPS